MRNRAWIARRLVLLALPIVAGVLLALAGCGGNAPNTVTITLSDYKIQASRTTFKTGVTYHFVIANKGKQNHELMLMPPVSGDMGMGSSTGDMDKLALFIVGADKLPPGATQHLDYTFTQPAAVGKLEFACHIGNHYQMGMRLPITVTS
jgi:uncharacterized cupredoxin-like copper-binding protein